MFWLRFLRLLGSVLWEGITNAFSLVLFLLPGRRKACRDSIRELMRRPMTTPKTPLSLLAVLALVAASATGCSTARGVPGSSFEEQIESFMWSVRAMSDQKGDLRSLRRDLENFFDPELHALPETIAHLGW